MPDKDREKLGKKLLGASRRAPTRPHRRAPKKPGAADKLRDLGGDRPAKRKGRPE
jgi:hypothetical protein